MRVLHHYQLSASSRFIRLVLAERGLMVLPKLEIPWQRSEDFLTLNPAGDVPVLVTEDGLAISGGMVIAEFIEETEDSSQHNLLWGEAPARAEIRRLVHWFEYKFSREVGTPLLSERVIKRFSGEGTTSSVVMRAAMSNLQIHLDYIDWLAEQGNWLTGRQISLADLAAAAHLSVLDFLGDIDWSRHPEAKRAIAPSNTIEITNFILTGSTKTNKVVPKGTAIMRPHIIGATVFNSHSRMLRGIKYTILGSSINTRIAMASTGAITRLKTGTINSAAPNPRNPLRKPPAAMPTKPKKTSSKERSRIVIIRPSPPRPFSLPYLVHKS